jgi:hypothetical protein
MGVETAFDAWRNVNDKLPKVAFDSRKPAPLLLEPDGENRIYYGPITIPGQENDLGLTLQYADQTSGEIVEADIIINSRHPFALLEPMGTTDDGTESGNMENCSAKYDVASVVTHEIGHFWGLGEDMVDTKATMYFSTPPCNVLKRKLKTDDVLAVTSLYSVAAPEAAGGSAKAAHCAMTSLGGACPSGAAALGVLVVFGAAARKRRRR